MIGPADVVQKTAVYVIGIAMTPTQITAEELRTAGHILLGFGGILVAAIGFLIRTAYKLGRDAEKFSTGLLAIAKIEIAVDEIPVLRTKIDSVAEFTRRNTSDISRILHRTSSHDIATNGHDGE